MSCGHKNQMNKKETQISEQRNRYTSKKQAVKLMNGDAKRWKKIEEQTDRQTDKQTQLASLQKLRQFGSA